MSCSYCSNQNQILPKACHSKSCQIVAHPSCIIDHQHEPCKCGFWLNIDQFKKINWLKCFTDVSIYWYRFFIVFINPILFIVGGFGYDLPDRLLSFDVILGYLLLNICLAIIFFLQGKNIPTWILSCVPVWVCLQILITHTFGWLLGNRFFTAKSYACGNIVFSSICLVPPFAFFTHHYASMNYSEIKIE